MVQQPPHRLAALGTSPPLCGGEEPLPQNSAPSLQPRFLAPTKWGRGGSAEGRDGEGDFKCSNPCLQDEWEVPHPPTSVPPLGCSVWPVM